MLVDAQLNLAAATVSVSSSPAAANILVDGKDTGKITPAELELEKGQHVILVRKRGFRDETFKETMAEGQSLGFSPVLLPLRFEALPRANLMRRIFGGADAIPAGKALLTIRTVPEGATIVVHDRLSSEKTNVRMLVDPGTYEIVLKLDGYKPATRTVVVAGGKQSYIDELLVKQP